MKRTNLFAAAGLMLVFAAFSLAEGPLELGSKAIMTDHAMKSVSGKMVSIADVKGGKGTLVIFTCNTCPWAQAWEGRIAALGNEYRKKGIGVLLINPNDPKIQAGDSHEAMVQRANAAGFTFDYVSDAGSEMAKAYGASRTPEVFLFDADDTLVYYGAVDDNGQDAAKVEQPFLANALKALVDGGQIATRSTRAMGCTIKWHKGAE